MNDDTKSGLLNIGSAAEYLGISIDTLRRWEKRGRINPLRSPGGHRYYSRQDLDALFGKRYTRDEETLRRTNEQLGKNDFPQQNPSYNDTTESNRQFEPQYKRSQDLLRETLGAEQVSQNQWPNLPPTYKAEAASNVSEPPSQPIMPYGSAPFFPVDKKPPEASPMLHPIETQPAVKEAFADRFFDPAGKTPQTASSATRNSQISENSIRQTSADFETPGHSISNILLPQQENETPQSHDWDVPSSAYRKDQYPVPFVEAAAHSPSGSRSDIPANEERSLSEEEIEKRINTNNYK